MRAVLVMLFAEIHKRKLQSVVFAICCMLCCSFLLGAIVLNFTIQDSFDLIYEELDAPNMSVRVQETESTQEELEQFLEGLSYVERHDISKSYLASNVKMPNRSMDFAFLATNADRQVERGHVIVNNAVYDAVPGDEIEISVNGQNVLLKIDDMIIDPINCAPESILPYFWINESQLQELTEGFEKGNYLIEAKVNQKDEIDESFATDYEAYFGHPFDGAMTAYEDIRHSYLFRYEIFGELFLFLCIFLFVIVMTITVLLSQMAVLADMKKNGILKSVGFTKHQINRKYILHYLLMAIGAGVIGVVVSGLVLRTWLGGMFVYIDRSLYRIKDLWQYQVFVLFIITALLYFVIRISIARIVNISPIDAIHFRQKHGSRWKPALFMTAPRLLPFNLGLTKCIQRKLESAFIFVLALGLGLLFLTSIYIIDGVNSANAHLAEWGIVEMDVYISRKTNADEVATGVLEALNKDAAVEFYYAALSDNISYRLSGSQVTRNVVGDVYDKTIPERLEYIFTEGRNPQTYNEVAVGINFAKENQLTIGDNIFIIRNGEETELEVVGIYPSFKQYADSIRFLTDDIQEFFGNQANGYYSVVLKDGENVNLFVQRMSEQFTDFDFFPMERSTTRSVNMLLPPLAICVALFVFIFFTVISCITRLMTIECQKELKIYSFVGFTQKQIKGVIRWRFAFPVLLGATIAIPLSIFTVPRWLSPLANRLGMIRFPIYPNISMIIMAMIGIFLCSYIATTVPSKRR